MACGDLGLEFVRHPGLVSSPVRCSQRLTGIEDVYDCVVEHVKFCLDCVLFGCDELLPVDVSEMMYGVACLAYSPLRLDGCWACLAVGVLNRDRLDDFVVCASEQVTCDRAVAERRVGEDWIEYLFAARLLFVDLPQRV